MQTLIKVTIILFLMSSIFKVAIAAHLTSNQSSTSNIAVRGNCNQTVTNSSGGTYILNCTLANPTIEQANLFYLIIGFTAAAPPLGGMINWQFVDKSNSDITISIDGRQVVYEDLNTIFSDETMKIPRGQHTFTIETNFVYYPSPTGVQAPPASASCTALLDVQAPGKIYPQLLLQQDFNGGLAPVRCGFNI